MMIRKVLEGSVIGIIEAFHYHNIYTERLNKSMKTV
jgi:hypothetical protein